MGSQVLFATPWTLGTAAADSKRLTVSPWMTRATLTLGDVPAGSLVVCKAGVGSGDSC